jgi:hypothetical protein
MPGGIVKGGGVAVEVEEVEVDPFVLVLELAALVSTSLKALFFFVLLLLLLLLPDAAAVVEDGEEEAGEAVVSIGG